MKQAGILMPIASLPSRLGIGDFGAFAYEWVDTLNHNNVGIWQILPLNPLGYGNSPYQPYSSFAGDEIYISLEYLHEDGLLKSIPEPFNRYSTKIDYNAVRAYKEKYLKEAFEEFNKASSQNEEYKNFKKQAWLKDYAVFRSLKHKNKEAGWNTWEEKDKEYSLETGSFSPELKEFLEYTYFIQFIFYTQWMKLKTYANEKNIKIMGDVPFYVGFDSADVWAGKKNFLLDKEYNPTYIAGVPPDYFTAMGQRWGNPIYDWDNMKKEDYVFWTNRIGYNAKLFDIVRVDHFRAFDTFWRVEASCETAIDGKWIEAPGYEVLEKILADMKDKELVAEDLGDLRPEVMVLKEHFNLKGMKIFEFDMELSKKYAFDSKLAKDWSKIIYYTGTHDNATHLEWCQSLSPAAYRKLKKFLKKQGIKDGGISKRVIEFILKSEAEYAIIAMADIMEFGSLGRINTPGTVGSPNWEWRVDTIEEMKYYLGKYKELMKR